MTEIMQVDDHKELLLTEARKAKEKAYCPYSNFEVGAAIITDDKKIFIGCNVENASYGLSNCAERTAIFNAISKGYRNFQAIAIVSSGKSPPFPCGACRQVLAEFNPDMVVYVDGLSESFTMSELLSHSFEKSQLTEKSSQP